MDYRLQLALLGALVLSVFTVVMAFLRGERRRAEDRGVAPIGSVGEALRRVPFGGRVLLLHLSAGPEGEAAEADTKRDPVIAAALGAPELRYVFLRAANDAEVAAHVFSKYAGTQPAGVCAVLLSGKKGEKLAVASAEGRPLAEWLPELLRKD